MAKKITRVVVTGGAGFIGSHIVDALIKRHIKTYVIDDLSHGKRSNVNPNATFHKLSITSPKLATLIEQIKPDIIVHTAAQQDVRVSVARPTHDAQVNVVGTANVIEAGVAAQVKKFIFLSTGGALYPAGGRPPFRETVPVEPLSPYAIAKRAGEWYFEFAHKVHGVDYTCLRLSNVYGPRQDTSSSGGVVSIFIARVLAGKAFVINGNGKQTRDYVYVSDVVRAVLLAMNKKTVGIFNIGTGTQTSLNGVVKILSRLMRTNTPKRHGPCKPGEVARSALDARLAKKALGWEPKITLEEGLKKTVKWFTHQAT